MVTESTDSPKPEQETQPPASQPAEVDPRDQHIADLEARLRGVQSTADQATAGVNKILQHLETSTSTARQRAEEQELAAALANVPEEQRPALELLHRQNQALQQRLEQQAPASPATDPVRQQAEEIVKQYPGIDPTDPRIDYSIVTSADRPGAPELGRFGAHLATLMQPASPAPAPAPTQTPTKSPPVDPGPVPSGAGSDEDDLLEAVVTGRMSREDYGRAMAAKGHKTGIGY